MQAQQAAAEQTDGAIITAPAPDAVIRTRSPTEKALLTIVMLAIGFTPR